MILDSNPAFVAEARFPEHPVLALTAEPLELLTNILTFAQRSGPAILARTVDRDRDGEEQKAM